MNRAMGMVLFFFYFRIVTKEYKIDKIHSFAVKYKGTFLYVNREKRHEEYGI